MSARACRALEARRSRMRCASWPKISASNTPNSWNWKFSPASAGWWMSARARSSSMGAEFARSSRSRNSRRCQSRIRWRCWWQSTTACSTGLPLDKVRELQSKLGPWLNQQAAEPMRRINSDGELEPDTRAALVTCRKRAGSTFESFGRRAGQVITLWRRNAKPLPELPRSMSCSR